LTVAKIQNLQQFDNQGSRSELCWILKWTQNLAALKQCALRNTCNKKAQKGGDPQQQQQQQQQLDVGWHAFKHISSEENGQQQL
jgi:hypothetical protein